MDNCSEDISGNLRLPPRLCNPGSESDKIYRITNHSNLRLVQTVKECLGAKLFGYIEKSFLGTFVKLSRRNVNFSGKIFHFLVQRRILTKGGDLWFAFANQPMRFSLREFHLVTGMPCEEVETPIPIVGDKLGTPPTEPYAWMSGNTNTDTISDLEQRLLYGFDKRWMSDQEKLSLGAAILLEGIVLSDSNTKKISKKRLLETLCFDKFCSKPWGKEAYELLAGSVTRLQEKSWRKFQYEVKGFPLAIHLWALCAVPKLGRLFAREHIMENMDLDIPWCLQWSMTKTPQMKEVLDVENSPHVEVKPIVGDPEYCNHLVQSHPDDKHFTDNIMELIEKGYRLKKNDWEKNCVNLYDALVDIKIGDQNQHEPTVSVCNYFLLYVADARKDSFI